MLPGNLSKYFDGKKRERSTCFLPPASQPRVESRVKLGKIFHTPTYLCTVHQTVSFTKNDIRGVTALQPEDVHVLSPQHKVTKLVQYL